MLDPSYLFYAIPAFIMAVVCIIIAIVMFFNPPVMDSPNKGIISLFLVMAVFAFIVGLTMISKGNDYNDIIRKQREEKQAFIMDHYNIDDPANIELGERSPKHDTFYVKTDDRILEVKIPDEEHFGEFILNETLIK